MISCNPKVKIVSSLAKVPEYQSQGAAAMDLHAAIEHSKLMAPGETFKVNTGLHIHIGNPLVCGLIIPRSGLGIKDRIVLANGSGLIDSDYQGEWIVALTNESSKLFTIEPGMRIAQVMFLPVIKAEFEIVEDFDEQTARGEGGFGSTGLVA